MAPPDLSHLAWSGARLVTGWELLHDAGRLTRLGPGELHLDLLRGSCRHGLTWVPAPAMAGILRSRLAATLENALLTWTDLVRAEAAIRYRLAGQNAAPSPMAAWSGYEGPMVCCQLEVTLTLATMEGSWSGTHRGTLSWPPDWARQR